MKYEMAIITGYGEIYPLAPIVHIEPTSCGELILKWQTPNGTSGEARLPGRVPADQNLWGDRAVLGARRGSCQARPTPHTGLSDAQLLEQFTTLMSGEFVTLEAGAAALGGAIGVRKRRGGMWVRYLLADALRNAFPDASARNRLVVLLRKKGVFKPGRQDDTSTRDVVIGGIKHAVYRISMPAFRKL